MGPRRPTIRSSDGPDTARRSTRSASATRSGCSSTPRTGELWETRTARWAATRSTSSGPGSNYGWPVVSYGRDYSGNKLGGLSGTTAENPMKAGMEDPFMYWMPSPAVTGIIVYTGDKFPAWKGNVFVGAMGSGNLGVAPAAPDHAEPRAAAAAAGQPVDALASSSSGLETSGRGRTASCISRPTRRQAPS